MSANEAETRKWEANIETVVTGIALERLAWKLHHLGKQADKNWREYPPSGTGHRLMSLAHSLMVEAGVLKGDSPRDDPNSDAPSSAT